MREKRDYKLTYIARERYRHFTGIGREQLPSLLPQLTLSGSSLENFLEFFRSNCMSLRSRRLRAVPGGDEEQEESFEGLVPGTKGVEN
jgi:hypothetical protein